MPVWYSYKEKRMKKVVVVGGGAAGLMAAIAAAKQGAKVTLLEKISRWERKYWLPEMAAAI